MFVLLNCDDLLTALKLIVVPAEIILMEIIQKGMKYQFNLYNFHKKQF